MPGPMSSQGTKLYLSGGPEAGLPITAVTKAQPAEVTVTGAVPSVGDYVVPTGTGFASIDNKMFRVSVVAIQVVTLEGSNTTSESGDVNAGCVVASGGV